MSGALCLLMSASKQGNSITASSNFGGGSTAAPSAISSGAPTLTVPGGGSRDVLISLVAFGSPNVQYRVSAGSYTALSDGMTITIANGQTLQFRINSPSTSGDQADIHVYDNVTSALVGNSTLIIL